MKEVTVKNEREGVFEQVKEVKIVEMRYAQMYWQ